MQITVENRFYKNHVKPEEMTLFVETFKETWKRLQDVLPLPECKEPSLKRACLAAFGMMPLFYQEQIFKRRLKEMTGLSLQQLEFVAYYEKFGDLHPDATKAIVRKLER